MYRYLLFDLDGTLTDPAEGITNSVRFALQKGGYPIPPTETLMEFIGPPLYESFRRIIGMDEAESFRCVSYYREYFAARGMLENAVIPGIPEMLAELTAHGYRLSLATAKPEVYAVPIMEHFGLSGYFDFLGGATLDTTRARKEQVIAYVLEHQHITDKAECLMIGDRYNDAEGAAACGIDCMGVLFGYGSREELTAAGAKLIAATPAEIPALLDAGAPDRK